MAVNDRVFFLLIILVVVSLIVIYSPSQCEQNGDTELQKYLYMIGQPDQMQGGLLSQDGLVNPYKYYHDRIKTDVDTYIHYGRQAVQKTSQTVFNTKEDITLYIKYIGIYTELQEVVEENRNLFETTILQSPTSKQADDYLFYPPYRPDEQYDRISSLITLSKNIVSDMSYWKDLVSLLYYDQKYHQKLKIKLTPEQRTSYGNQLKSLLLSAQTFLDTQQNLRSELQIIRKAQDEWERNKAQLEKSQTEPIAQPQPTIQQTPVQSKQPVQPVVKVKKPIIQPQPPVYFQELQRSPCNIF